MDRLKRTITHWTGGGGRASNVDKKHYHFITEFDGTVVEGHEEPEDNIVTADDDYAAHTLNLNTGSIGCAMAGMHGAVEVPLSYGSAPLTREQFEAHCKHLAEIHQAYGIPVTMETCLTHAEVEPTLGVKQRGKWDITVLPFEPSIRGAIPVGNYMRKRVMAYTSSETTTIQISFSTIAQGTRGLQVREAQTLLRDTGYFPGSIDGIFGPRTRDAVMSFQADNGLRVDGVVGDNTWAALMQSEPRPNRDTTVQELREAGSQTIRQTDRVDEVLGGGAVLAAGGTLLEGLSGATGALGEAESALKTAQHILLTYWPLLLALGVGMVVWYSMRKIRSQRVHDHKTGAHLGR